MKTEREILFRDFGFKEKNTQNIELIANRRLLKSFWEKDGYWKKVDEPWEHIPEPLWSIALGTGIVIYCLGSMIYTAYSMSVWCIGLGG